MKAVAYYRVSTQRQGFDGLGMAAQRKAVQHHITNTNADLLATFTEVESGKRNDRPQLAAAIALCRKKKAVLVVSRLDRLARNAAFLLSLRDSGVSFVALDCPGANKLTIGILACVAEDERDRISQRTRDALAQAKARGVKLGNPKLKRARKKALVAARCKARDHAAKLKPTIKSIRKAGVTSYTGIAQALNARGISTVNGHTWYAQSVKNLLSW